MDRIGVDMDARARMPRGLRPSTGRPCQPGAGAEPHAAIIMVPRPPGHDCGVQRCGAAVQRCGAAVQGGDVQGVFSLRTQEPRPGLLLFESRLD